MDQPQPSLETVPAAAAPRTSVAGRLINVFATPGEVFDELKAGPVRTANWLVPAALLVLMSWLSAWLIFSQASIQQQLNDISNRAIDRQVEKGKLTDAQADQAREVAEKWGSVGYKVGGYVAPVFMAFALPFWWGLILWLSGAKALKVSFSYMKAVEVAGLANMIMVLDVVVRTLLILVTGNLFASPGLALALKQFDPQNPAHTLLSLASVTVFWVMLVRSIGLSRLTGASLAKAAAWVFGIWAAYTGLLIGVGAAVRAAFGG
jgi:hypothetical protein